MKPHLDDGAPATEILFTTSDYTIDGMLEIPAYQLEDNSMHIHDVVWGEEYIGEGEYDSLLVELARSPLFRRLQAVEQLTLPAEYTTIPNTSQFSRWQHIWGSLVFVRKMTKDDERFSERDRMVLQLRTLFSDVGQTAFSHLGDWLFQEDNTSEDLHDQDLRALLETFEVEALLKEYGLTLDETVFPNVEDWVECPSPNLCVDRVDYGMREILRWLSPPSPLFHQRSKLSHPKQLFAINNDNMLETTDQDFALHFAAAYNLLPTEHWAQPIHRLQLELMQVAVKRALLDGHFSEGIMLPSPPHPRDRLYGIDSDFQFAFYDWEGIVLSDTMRHIGLAQRQIYSRARRHDLALVLDSKELGHFPEATTAYSEQSRSYGLVAPQVELEQVDTPERTIRLGKSGLEVELPPLKTRSIDPLVGFSDGTSKPLSEIDSNFANYKAEQAQAISLGYKALLLLNKDTTKRLHKVVASTNEHWQATANMSRDPDALREIIGQAALYAAGRCFDNIRDW